MRKHLHLVLASSLIVGGLGFALADDKVVEKTTERTVPGDTLQPLALPQGAAAKELKEQGDVRNAFKAVTEAAWSNDAFDKIVDRLVDADRDRIKKFKDTKPDWKPLQDRVASFSSQFQQKYGKGVKLDEKFVFGDKGWVAIQQGEVADAAAIIGHWPVNPTAATLAQAASGKTPAAPADTAQQSRDAGKAQGGSTNLEKGREIAVARYPASHGLPALDLSMIHEKPDTWRFDIPDNIDGHKLFENLVHHLDMMGDPKNWPNDPNEAYREVAHHILMAMYDVNQPAEHGH
jgi:hypothetical protein